MVRLDPWGILLAVVFAASLAGIYYWMLRLSPVRPPRAARKPGSAEGLPRILVPMTDAVSSQRAVELACRLGDGHPPELVLVHVVEVPDTMLLDAAMPDRDNLGREALEMGRVIARRYGCQARTYLVHHRNAAQGVLQVADEESVDAIVLGESVKNRPASGEWSKMSVKLQRRAQGDGWL